MVTSFVDSCFTYTPCSLSNEQPMEGFGGTSANAQLISTLQTVLTHGVTRLRKTSCRTYDSKEASYDARGALKPRFSSSLPCLFKPKLDPRLKLRGCGLGSGHRYLHGTTSSDVMFLEEREIMSTRYENGRRSKASAIQILPILATRFFIKPCLRYIVKQLPHSFRDKALGSHEYASSLTTLLQVASRGEGPMLYPNPGATRCTSLRSFPQISQSAL